MTRRSSGGGSVYNARGREPASLVHNSSHTNSLKGLPLKELGQLEGQRSPDMPTTIESSRKGLYYVSAGRAPDQGNMDKSGLGVVIPVSGLASAQLSIA